MTSIIAYFSALTDWMKDLFIEPENLGQVGENQQCQKMYCMS